MAFKSGSQWNGNSKGRPKKFTIKDCITPKQAEGLLKIAVKKAEEGNLDMLKFLLDHLYGKAPQNMTFGEDGSGIVVNMTVTKK
jgi:hypothetical protein